MIYLTQDYLRHDGMTSPLESYQKMVFDLQITNQLGILSVIDSQA